MAWCENPRCGKKNLSKDDVEFDEDTRKVLCHGCMVLWHPGWMPPTGPTVIPRVAESDEGFRYDISLNNRTGFTAQFGFGEYTLAFHASPTELRRLVGAKS